MDLLADSDIDHEVQIRLRRPENADSEPTKDGTIQLARYDYRPVADVAITWSNEETSSVYSLFGR